MKKLYTGVIIGLIGILTVVSCKKDVNASIGANNPFAAIFVVKKAYKGADVTLNSENLDGATSTGGIVISDPASSNIPKGMLAVQNTSRGITRGLLIELGNVDVPFVPGDSISIQLAGASLTKVNQSMRLRGLNLSSITKVSSANPQQTQTVSTNLLAQNPDEYEGRLITITNASFNPVPVAGDVYAGDKVINDGFGDVVLHTETAALYANSQLPEAVNVTGIVFASSTGGAVVPQIWPRTETDIFRVVILDPSPFIITGYLLDPQGSDANYEYIQLLATENIDFAVDNYALVTTNNAGGSIPVGFPTNGWATGGLRTYKFNLTSGTVNKGEFFYVGGTTKLLWGAGSTDISTSKWIASVNYTTTTGADFGNVTTNLLGNSGNPAGIAVFKTTTVTEASVPLDVIFYGGNNGSLYNAGPPAAGYRINYTDYYDLKNPATLADQPYFFMGSNSGKFGFPAATNFAKLGGVYNLKTGRWSTGRTLVGLPLTLTSSVSAIETGDGISKIEE